MNFRTRPHFEDRQIVQYIGESVKLSGDTLYANTGGIRIYPTVLDFTGATIGQSAVTINNLTGYLNDNNRLSGLIINPPILKLSGGTGTTTVNIENFVLKAIDSDGTAAWSPISGISWSVSACTSPFITTDIQPCTPGGTITINAGDLEINNTVRINDGSQSNGYVFTSDGSGNGSWLPPVDNYTTGATLNGTVIEFDRNDLSNAYSVDIKPALLDYLPLRITGNTVVSIDNNVDLYFSGFTGSSIINYVNYGDSLQYINGSVISKDYAALFNRTVINNTPPVFETFSVYAIQTKGIALDYSDSGGTVNEFFVSKSNMRAKSTLPTFNGITYDSDYSANYTNRSLVDKEYVDNLVSSSVFTGNTSASCITDLYVTNLYGCSPITVWDSIQSVGSTASGTTSFAFGINNVSSGIASFAEGGNNISSGAASHAEGSNNIASGDNSHAEGFQTISTGLRSHSEGFITSATTTNAHAEGFQTLASGINSHAQGGLTVASGPNSHAEGEESIASGRDSHSEGLRTEAIGDYSHAEGNLTEAIGVNSHAEGEESIASGTTSHAEGYQTQAIGDYSHAEGGQTEAIGIGSHAEGGQTQAIGGFSHAEGALTQAIGIGSHAEGVLTRAIGLYSHAEGGDTRAIGNYSHAGGSGSLFGGSYVFAEGDSSFVHQGVSGSGPMGTSATNSAILGGRDNIINSGATESAILGGRDNIINSGATASIILGGSNLTASLSSTVYVPDFVIKKSASVPVNSADPVGEEGSITWDNNYFYWKTSGGWLRISGSSF